MKRLLVIGHGLPEPQSTGAGVRMMQLLALFEESGYELYFCSVAPPTGDSAVEKANIPYTQIELNSDSFNDFVANLDPEVVLYDRFMTEEQFGWRVRESCPRAFTILDTEDLHFLRKDREAGHVLINPSGTLNDIAKRELAAIFRCDLTLLISERELSLLQKMFPSSNNHLYYLPFLVKPEELKVDHPTFEEREGFYFVGNGKHKPNLAAIEYLKEIWPQFQRFGVRYTMNIYGAYLPESVMQLHDPENGFLVHGFVEDLHKAI